MPQSFLSIFAAVYLFMAPPLIAKVYHERVIWQENPAHEAFVSWTSDDLGKKSYVLYDTVSQGGKLDAYQLRQAVTYEGRFERSWRLTQTPYYHHAKLTNLEPDTAYYFVVVTDQDQSREFWFRTAPADGSDFSLMFGGDSRSDHPQRIRMNQLMGETFERQPSILGLVHGGDYIGDGSKWSEWGQWLHHHNYTTTNDQRILPIIPTRGNHEYSAQLFNEVFAFPGNGQAYFTTKIQNIAIITLNTEISVHGEQRSWLAEELKARSQDSKWLVANYHRPAYPAVKRPSSAKAAWVPLFEQFQLDLVFESDGHVYKQTSPIYKDRLDNERGIIYVGEGGLGVKQREPNYNLWYLQNQGFAASSHHFQILRISEDNLFFEGIAEDARILTTVTRDPRPDRQHL